ncbi:hypothetical protein VTO42DRAFT_7009 [Malbranchea cinnamomea]
MSEPRGRRRNPSRTSRGNPDYRETMESTSPAPSEEMEPEAYEAKQFFTRSDIVELLEAIKTIASRQATPATDDKSGRERELNSYRKDLKTRLEIKPLLQFNGTNFSAWRTAILGDAEIIDAQDILLKNQIEPPEGLSDLEAEKWHIRNNFIHLRMFQSLTTNIRQTTRNLDNRKAASLWTQLCAEYAISLPEERLQTLREMIRLFVKKDDFHTFLRTFRRLEARYRDLATSLDDGEIKNLPLTEFQNQLATRAPKRYRGQQQPSQQQNSANSAVESTTRQDDKGDGKKRRNNIPKWKKMQKGKKDRKDDTDFESPQSMNSQNNNSSVDVLATQPSANAAVIPDTYVTVALTVFATATPRSTEWLFDSCASYSMTGNKAAFATFTRGRFAADVTTAIGATGRVEGKGTVILDVNGGTMEIHDVLYIPGLQVNLLSFAGLEDQGFRISLSNTSPAYFTIKSPNGDSFTATRTLNSAIYKITDTSFDEYEEIPVLEDCHVYMTTATDASKINLPPAPPAQADPAERPIVSKSLREWHEDLGHLHVNSITALEKTPGSCIKILGDKTKFFCKPCIEAGLTRKISKTPIPRCKLPLQRIHIDIIGGGKSLDDNSDHPMESRKGAKYAMLITCDATRASKYDPALWILTATTRKRLYMTIYVDDLLIFAEDEPDADWLMNSLREKLEIKDLLIPEKYLGMEIKEVLDENSGKRTAVRLTQTRYIEQLIEDFRLEDANPVQTPLDTSFIPDDKELPEQEAGFTKQPSLLAQFNTKPTPKCYKQLLRVLRYLKGSKNLGIEYRAEGTDVGMPLGYSDSDWAGPLNGDRKSTGGFVFIFAGAPIGWKSNKQSCVALSSNEAEYMALSEAAREATWLRNLLLDLSLDNPSISDQNPIKICVDNKGAIDLAKIDGITKRSKHVDTRFHYSREQQLLGVITIVYVPTTEMAADGLTKPLPTPSFRRFINQLGLR